MTPARSPSLTLRLTLLFALASACVLLLLGLLIGHSVEHHFEEMDMEILTEKMQLIGHLLEPPEGTHTDAVFTRQLDSTFADQHGLMIAVNGPDQHAVYATADAWFPDGLLKSATITTTANDKSTDREHPHPVKWAGNDGSLWRGIAKAVRSGSQPDASYTIAVATEITHHAHFMNSFQTTLWVFMASASLSMGGLGWFVVRRGLLPLQAIKHQASEITAHRLDSRLPVESIPVELADLATTLNDMLSRLEEAFRRLSDFSADIAHELRTPVSNLLTQTQVTLLKSRSADEYRDILASNAEEFERLSRTISDMLFLAKADKQQIVPKLEQYELSDDVAGLLDYYQVLADEKSIELALVGHGQVEGDRLMLRRAVDNLLSNALRHTPAGGKVTVKIWHDDGGLIRLAVENTGSPIPAEHLPRLFDRFYRADGSRRGSAENSGLGLAITRSIMVTHGGEITVESTHDMTCFTLSLPIKSGSVAG